MTGDAPLLLTDPLNFGFAPTPQSPLYKTGVQHAPEEPASHPNVGAYQSGDSWRPGCKFHPRCTLKTTDDATVAWGGHRSFKTIQACVNDVAKLPAGG